MPPQSREGVWLPPLKAKIFDFVDRHPGITAAGISAQCGISVNCVRQHVYQINSLLAGTRVKISGTNLAWDRDGVKGCYRVARSKQRAPLRRDG